MFINAKLHATMYHLREHKNIWKTVCSLKLHGTSFLLQNPITDVRVSRRPPTESQRYQYYRQYVADYREFGIKIVLLKVLLVFFLSTSVINNTHHQLQFNIPRKPTTDLIIYNDSCHPSIYLSIYLSACLSIYLFIYLSMALQPLWTLAAFSVS
jgi:hypothetical protein